MSDLNIKIYSDGANINDMMQAYKENTVDGFTTNPTLMARAGITDYLGFAKEALSQIKGIIHFKIRCDIKMKSVGNVFEH